MYFSDFDSSPRLLLIAVGFLFLLSISVTPVLADDVNYRYVNMSKQDLKSKGKKISVIRSPLSGAPSIKEDESTLRIELNTGKSIDKPINVWLKPSFGEAREKIQLDVETVEKNQPSELWPDKTVNVVEVSVPSLDGDLREDLYDLHVKWKRYWGLITVKDFQPRALQVTDEIPDDPKVATIADPQVGDPRALMGGASEAWNEKSLNPLDYSWSEVIGDASPGGRWGGFQKVVQEINAQDPDFILVSGDLTFGAGYKYEMEDAYRLLNQFQAPTFVSSGNHDGYAIPLRPDGQTRWEKVFGPLYYSRNIGSNLHLTSINSYDWAGKHRNPLTWGGQVKGDQLQWLDNDLTSWRNSNPNGTLVTFAHHDPSWEQSPGVVDGMLDHGGAKDQRWSGDNRLSLRNLLNDAKVDVHFAGHSHVNRVARYVDDDSQYGKLVETLGSDCFREVEPKSGTLNDEYSLTDCNNAGSSSPSQFALKYDVLNESHGPLFVETTTVSSETGEYWGWRMFPLDRNSGYWSYYNGYQRGGVDPSDLGYPMTDGELQNLEDAQPIPDHFHGNVNSDVVDVGYYSTPSYLLDVNTVTDKPTQVTYRVENNSEVGVSGTITATLETCGYVSTTNGDKKWTRTDTDAERTDVSVSYSVGANSSKEVTARSWTGTSSCGSSGSWL